MGWSPLLTPTVLPRSHGGMGMHPTPPSSSPDGRYRSVGTSRLDGVPTDGETTALFDCGGNKMMRESLGELTAPEGHQVSLAICNDDRIDAVQRRPKRFLSAEQKYEIWLKLLTGELTSTQAAAQAGVDRSTILTLRKRAKDGAMAALQATHLVRCRDATESGELARLAAENACLQASNVELSIELLALRGSSWD